MSRAEMKGADDCGRRESILMATLQLIGEQGCDGLSHRKIAKAAGVPLGSTTYYFASREALLLEAFRLYMRQFESRLARSLDRVQPYEAADPLSAVADFLVQLVDDELREPTLLRAEIELILYSVKHLELSEEFASWEDGMARPLARHLAEQGFALPEQLASALLRLTRGYEIQALTRSDLGIAEFRQQLLRLLQAYREHGDV